MNLAQLIDPQWVQERFPHRQWFAPAQQTAVGGGVPESTSAQEGGKSSNPWWHPRSRRALGIHQREVLEVMANFPDEWWTSTDIGERVFAGSTRRAFLILDRLVAKRLVEQEGARKHYRFRLTSAGAAALAQ